MSLTTNLTFKKTLSLITPSLLTFLSTKVLNVLFFRKIYLRHIQTIQIRDVLEEIFILDTYSDFKLLKKKKIKKFCKIYTLRNLVGLSLCVQTLVLKSRFDDFFNLVVLKTRLLCDSKETDLFFFKKVLSLTEATPGFKNFMFLKPTKRGYLVYGLGLRGFLPVLDAKFLLARIKKSMFLTTPRFTKRYIFLHFLNFLKIKNGFSTENGNFLICRFPFVSLKVQFFKKKNKIFKKNQYSGRYRRITQKMKSFSFNFIFFSDMKSSSV